MAALTTLSANRMFGGWHKKYQHSSATLNCEMQFSVYFPPQYQTDKELPVLYWLSGLTCTDDNFSHKAGAQQYAARWGIILVIPDTSPRGDGVADDDGYDLGKGAGFYVNATQSPWSAHYQMYDYVVSELPEIITQHISASSKISISGHSMGGHGALTIALRNPQRFCSVSAFAPIVNPMACDWGKKALSAYLGDDQQSWQLYDSCALLEAHGLSMPCLIDQGLADDFLTSQQLTRPFDDLCKKMSLDIQVNYRADYDHSYFFIASFIEAHVRFHAKAMGINITHD